MGGGGSSMCYRRYCDTYLHGWARIAIDNENNQIRALENDNRNFNTDINNHSNWYNYTLVPQYYNAANNVTRLRSEISGIDGNIGTGERNYKDEIIKAILANDIDIKIIESEQDRYKHLSDDDIYYIEFG